jgi:hypothetical protein
MVGTCAGAGVVLFMFIIIEPSGIARYAAVGWESRPHRSSLPPWRYHECLLAWALLQNYGPLLHISPAYGRFGASAVDRMRCGPSAPLSAPCVAPRGAVTAWQRARQGHTPPRVVPRWHARMQERPAGRAVC